jgi:phosphate transport system substrate-binding protein
LNTGYCTNLPSACSLAARKEVIPMGAPDSKCPECNSGLLATKAGRGGKTVRAIMGAAVALLIGIGGYVMFKESSSNGTQVATASSSGSTPTPTPIRAPTAPTVPPPVVASKTLLRLSGSNTIGSALAPRMVEAWLASMGASGVATRQREKDGQKIPESVVQATLNNAAVEVEIRAHGSGDAFKHLADGSADIGMASRRIKPNESASLSNLGNMFSRDNEHVIALDGIAVIVAPGNPVPSLSRQNLAKMFSGEITDWSQVGGTAGPIKLYARDQNSGTFDTFQALVLGSSKLSAQATRIEDSAELEAAVAAAPSSIGFVGLPYVKSAKALPVSDGQAMALAPTVFTVKKEDYAPVPVHRSQPS